MTKSMYTGTSSSFANLTQDWVSYAEYVVAQRAIPDVRDGLKFSHRHILEALYRQNVYSPVKGNAVVGYTSILHPHGDSSIYDAAVLMTDRNGSWNVPLLQAQGNLGRHFSHHTLIPAKPRYTEMGLHPWANDLLLDADYVDTRPSVDGGEEMEVLPARYPFLLTVGHKGVALGLSTRIPPFNFHDVVELTRYYVEHGTFNNKVIYPDFPTGGQIVADEREAVKFMNSGKGTYKVRANFYIQGNEIIITEIPYESYTDVIYETLLKLQDETSLIKSVNLADDLQGARVIVTAPSADLVYDLQTFLFQKRTLQTSQTTNMVWLKNGQIYEGGVYSIIQEWVAFREEILHRRVSATLDKLLTESTRLQYFIELVDNIPHRDTYLDKVVNGSSALAKAYLVELFSNHATLPPIPDDVISWIYSRRVSAFNRSNSYKERFTNLQSEIQTQRDYLSNIRVLLLEDLIQLQQEHANQHPRKTVISNYDVVVTRSSAKEQAPEYQGFLSWNKEGIILLGDSSLDNSLVSYFTDNGNNLFIGLAYDGSIAKIWTSQLTPGTPIAVTTHCGLESDNMIVKLLPANDEPQLLLFSNGDVTWFDPSELITARKTKRVKGYLPHLQDLVAIIPQSQVLAVMGCRLAPSHPIEITNIPKELLFHPNVKLTRRAAFEDCTHYALNVSDTQIARTSIPGSLTDLDPDFDWNSVLKEF